MDRKIYRRLEGKDKIVLLSTHIVSVIEAIASELVVMKKGEVLKTGNVDDLVQSVKGQVWETVVNHEVYQSTGGACIGGLLYLTGGINID